MILHQMGKFHGPMTRTTPTGSFLIRHLFSLKGKSTGTYSSLVQVSIYVSYQSLESYVFDDVDSVLEGHYDFLAMSFLQRFPKISIKCASQLIKVV